MVLKILVLFQSHEVVIQAYFSWEQLSFPSSFSQVLTYSTQDLQADHSQCLWTLKTGMHVDVIASQKLG